MSHPNARHGSFVEIYPARVVYTSACCVHQPVCTPARVYTSPCVHQPVLCTPARVYTSPCVHQPLCTPARVYTSPCVQVDQAVYAAIQRSVQYERRLHTDSSHKAAAVNTGVNASVNAGVNACVHPLRGAMAATPSYSKGASVSSQTNGKPLLVLFTPQSPR